MSELVPPFDWFRVVVAPWTEDFATFGWIMLMAFLVTAACGLVGNYLLLRRLALMGDAVSHSVLPGLVIAFLLSQTRGTVAMFVGALAAGLVTTVIIELIHSKTRVKQDAAMGITFSTLFAIGVVMTTVFASRIDLDAECVLFGEIAYVPLEPLVEVGGLTVAPASVLRMGIVLLTVVAAIVIFYKELLVTAFDAGLSRNLGVNPTVAHFGLMAALSIVVVSAFEAVGAILVIAMIILPGATASLLTTRLPWRHGLAVAHAAVSSILGTHLGIWLECSLGAAMVVAGTGLFGLAWILHPGTGLLWRLRNPLSTQIKPSEVRPQET
jgi:manganese/zinc/iron transport system permease protein